MNVTIYWQTMRVNSRDLPALMEHVTRGSNACADYKLNNPRSDTFLMVEKVRKEFIVHCMATKFEFARYTMKEGG